MRPSKRFASFCTGTLTTRLSANPGRFGAGMKRAIAAGVGLIRFEEIWPPVNVVRFVPAAVPLNGENNVTPEMLLKLPVIAPGTGDRKSTRLHSSHVALSRMPT